MHKIDQDKRSAALQIVSEFEGAADLSYKQFSAKLKATSHPNSLMGVRMPVVRKSAKKLAKLLDSTQAIDLLLPLAKQWYEHKLLLGLVLKETVQPEEVDRVISLLYSLCDGWATPDLYQEVMSRMIKEGAGDKVIAAAKAHVNDSNEFARRLSIVSYFPLLKQGEVAIEETLDHIRLFEHDDAYYVEMACAWLLAEIKLTHPNTDITISSPSLLKRYRQKLRESLRHKS